MKTDRRQDLRTNELSQQLEQISEYFKKNATWLTGIVVVAAVIVGGTFWYSHYRETRRLDAWAALSKASVPSADATASPFATFDSVIQQNLSPGLTTEALMLTGETAIKKYTGASPATPPATASAPAAEPADWAAKATEAYAEVLAKSPDDLPAAGAAMITLGVLSEDRKEWDKARGWYEKITTDSRFAHFPFHGEAAYRISHLDRWAAPVTFLPPQHTVLEPSAMPPPPPGTTPGGGTSPFTIKPLPGGPPTGAQPTGAVPPGATPPPTTPAPVTPPPTANPPAANPPSGNQPPANPPSANPTPANPPAGAQPTGNPPANPPAGNPPPAAPSGQPQKPAQPAEGNPPANDG